MVVTRRSLVLVLVGLGACARGPEPSPEARAEARRVWQERCTNCHGERGFGNGPGARVLDPKPRVLADSSWQAQVTDEHIAGVIVNGGQSVGKSPLMAANPDLARKPEVLTALVELVRSL